MCSRTTLCRNDLIAGWSHLDLVTKCDKGMNAFVKRIESEATFIHFVIGSIKKHVDAAIKEWAFSQFYAGAGNVDRTGTSSSPSRSSSNAAEEFKNTHECRSSENRASKLMKSSSRGFPSTKRAKSQLAGRSGSGSHRREVWESKESNQDRSWLSSETLRSPERKTHLRGLKWRVISPKIIPRLLNGMLKHLDTSHTM